MLSKSQIKFIRSLHLKKFREQHQQFIIEGQKMIESALEFAPELIVNIYGTEEIDFKNDINFQQIDEKSLKQISALKHPQKFLAICNYIPQKNTSSNFYLALDTVQDPGNLGTILRLAAWFDVAHILATKETVDLYNPKVVQASMGAIFNVQMTYLDLKDFLNSTTLPIYGAILQGKNIYQSSFKKHGILILGNEGNGISKEILPFVQGGLTIPKFGEGESLNVAMSAAIFLSEFSRNN